MTERSILIVSAGIGGLSTGCYAQMNGYRARILEMHSTPGGVCTSWKRDCYTFDGCIHNLAGTTPRSAFHGMWRELGVIPGIRMHAYDELVRVERPDGEPLTLYTDLDRLEQHLKRLATADAADVATPMTTLRFTGNGHGYRAPVTAMVRALFTGRRLSQALPGLTNFYMVEQWAGVAGVPMVAAMGRDVVRAICRADGRTFTTSSEPVAERRVAASA